MANNKSDKHATYQKVKNQLQQLLSNATEGTVASLKAAIESIREEAGNTTSPSTIVNTYKDGNGRNALHFACSSSNLQTVQCLLDDKDISVDIDINCEDDAGETPLFVCARLNLLDCARLLLKKGATVNALNKKGCTPLHYAAEVDAVEFMDFLMDNGAKADVCALMGTPLQWAVAHGHEAALTALLARKADPNKSSVQSMKATADARPYPPALVLACAMAKSPMVDMLLNAGADANVTDDAGWTALHCAAESGCMHAVKALVERKADPNVVTEGKTALTLAMEGKHKEVVEYLRPLTTVAAEATIPHAKALQAGPEHETDKTHGQSQLQAGGDEAASSLTAGEEDEALGDDDPSVVARVKDAEQLKAEGNTKYNAKEYEAALQCYAKALQACPKTVSTRPLRAVLHANMSVCHLNLERAPLALESAMNAVFTNPEWSKGYYRLAHAYKALGDLMECAQQLWEALSRDPNNDTLRDEFKVVTLEARKQHKQTTGRI